MRAGDTARTVIDQYRVFKSRWRYWGRRSAAVEDSRLPALGKPATQARLMLNPHRRKPQPKRRRSPRPQSETRGA